MPRTVHVPTPVSVLSWALIVAYVCGVYIHIKGNADIQHFVFKTVLLKPHTCHCSQPFL